MSQTLRDKIKQRMSELSIEPKRSLGQNFLVSDSVVDRIIKSAQLDKYSLAVEIGPGLGALTDHLIESKIDLILFELDQKFSEYWRGKGQELIEGDALKYDWSQFPWEKGSSVLLSNLPYQISSRIVVEFSLLNPCFDRMVLMFQKEVAQRLVAEPSTEDYGLLTVIAQAFWSLHVVLEAGAIDFMPKPNVASRVVRFDKIETNDKVRTKEFLNFVKICFANRRKKMLPKLKSYHDKDKLGEIFDSVGLDEGVRAEKLSPEQFIELYLAIKK